jgi:hypothetical protein
MVHVASAQPPLSALRSVLLAVGGAIALTVGGPAVADAVTVYVANNGMDSASCGTLVQPCRSISQGLARGAALAARDGSTPVIVVRPGRYGDLDHDGDLTDPGEEFSGVGHACNCMIRIAGKAIVESEHGSAVTVIDPGVTPGFRRVVSIEANDVTFGRPNKGFTVIGTSPRPGPKSSVPEGVRVAPSIGRATIRGNLVFGATNTGFLVASGSDHRIEGNFATGNLTGFVLNGTAVNVIENVATKNGIGFQTGFEGTAVNHQLTRNVATDNGDAGFVIRGDRITVRSSTASGNLGNGFTIGGTNVTFRRNQVVGNVGRGIHLLPGATGAAVSLNNIFGNNPGPNCGLFNESGASLNAAKNWWGSPAGSSTDPGDAACHTSPTNTNPPAPAPIVIQTLTWF